MLEFKRECMQGLSNMIKKVQDKSPLKYLTVRQMVCLDPSVMYREPERGRNHMKGLVQRFLQDKQLTDTSLGKNKANYRLHMNLSSIYFAGNAQ